VLPVKAGRRALDYLLWARGDTILAQPWDPDAARLLYNLYGCHDAPGRGEFNFGSYCNRKVDDLTAAAMAETEPAKREQIVKEAIERSSVEAPPQAIERQANQILESMAASLDRQGISIEQYLQFSGKDEQAFRAELLAEGEQALKRSVVLASIADAEGLEVGEDEVRREIELAASSADNPTRATRQALARPETKARIEAILRARKGADRLFELTGAADEPEPSDQEVSETPAEVNV